MNTLAELIANGTITVEELASATELIERAKLVTEGVEACKKTISFPFGSTRINCFKQMHGDADYWAECTVEGNFTAYSNWGGNHITGTCNLNNFENVFKSFENDDFAYIHKKFLQEQIRKASAK